MLLAFHQAHSTEDRMGATSFTELRDLKASALRTTRQEHEAIIGESSSGIVADHARKDTLGELRSQKAPKSAAIISDKNDRQSLLTKDQDARGQALESNSTESLIDLPNYRDPEQTWGCEHRFVTMAGQSEYPRELRRVLPCNSLSGLKR